MKPQEVYALLEEECGRGTEVGRLSPMQKWLLEESRKRVREQGG